MLTVNQIRSIAAERGLPETTIEKDYILTWILISISQGISKDMYIFRGGTALKKIYFPEYRYSEDLDLLVQNKLLTVQSLKRDLDMTFKRVKSWTNIDLLVTNWESNYQERIQSFIGFRGPLGTSIGQRTLQVDFVSLTFPAIEASIKPLLLDYPDMAEFHPSFLTLSLADIFADKLHAIYDRPEPRDLYDLYQIIKKEKPPLRKITKQFKRKYNDELDHNRISSQIKSNLYKRLWFTRLAHQVTELPALSTVISTVTTYLKQ